MAPFGCYRDGRRRARTTALTAKMPMSSSTSSPGFEISSQGVVAVEVDGASAADAVGVGADVPVALGIGVGVGVGVGVGAGTASTSVTSVALSLELSGSLTVLLIATLIVWLPAGVEAGTV